MATIICSECNNELTVKDSKSETVPYSDELGGELQTSESFVVEPCEKCLEKTYQKGYTQGEKIEQECQQINHG